MTIAADDGIEPASVDLNADAGESYGLWRMGRDEDLFPLVSSVNLACGFHAGDPGTMVGAVLIAIRHGVAIGAHPGYPDRVGFGRRAMDIHPSEVKADVLYQLGALEGIVRSVGGRLHHVKPHGALYQRMTTDEALTESVAKAVNSFDANLPLVVLAGSNMERWATDNGVATVAEAYPDRAYLAAGQLAPRSLAEALVTEPHEVGKRAVRMAKGEPVEALDDGSVTVRAQTLCLHGDNPEAVATARAVRSALESNGIRVAAY